MKTSQPSRNILFIGPSAYPLGGVATWFNYIVPGLRQRGWNVTLGLVEGRFHDVDVYLSVHPDHQVVRIPYGTGTKEGRIRRLVQAILRAQPDVVVAVNIADVVRAVDRIRAISGCSLRLVTALHATQPEFIGEMRVCAQTLDAVVCTNRLTCELVSGCSSVAPNRIYYAPYGVDTNDLSRKEQTNSDDIFRIAYVGRLEQAQKRSGDLVPIVAELDRRRLAYQLIIAGSGPEEDRLKATLADGASRGRVRFLGTLAGADLFSQVYGSADALLITSHWETGPIVAWEAMANGVAVVTSG
jgi:glycosyltransferase involved in cell wall biosynthesis